VTLCAFDHPPGIHHDPEHERAPDDAISFVEAGSFEVRVGGGLYRLAPGDLFVTERGMEFSCTHDCEAPTDRCLTVSFDSEAVEDLRRADVPALRPPLARQSRTQHYIRHRLGTCGPGQEIRLELLAGALFESLASNGAASRRPGPVTPLMRRVDRAIDLIETDYERPLTLGDLARAAGLSTFHFARVFRTLVGLPPHRYLTAVRLRHAARLLRDGAGVSYTCYEVGFASLSHFVTAFRRRFGIVPSEVRKVGRPPVLRAALRAPVWERR
jgi:AraC-like DNA-binding protein